jgi:hypothetical protein
MFRFAPRHTFTAAAAFLLASVAHAAPSLADYKYFRTLSIDLKGRMPTRQEIAEFEQPSFSVETWIDAQLGKPEYAQRIRQIYQDLLRLEVGPSVLFRPFANTLRRALVTSPAGVKTYVYYRSFQQRENALQSNKFCLSEAESGVKFRDGSTVQVLPPDAALPAVPQAVWDASTVDVTPWWGTFAETGDLTLDPATNKAANGQLVGPTIRVCKEEAQVAATAPGTTSNVYKQVGNLDCTTDSGLRGSHLCGCGPRLERCLPNAGSAIENATFVFPTKVPLGQDLPFEIKAERNSELVRQNWALEFTHFMDDLLVTDSDFRGVLTSPGTMVNGPLSKFYQTIAAGQCCGTGVYYKHTSPAALFEPANVPKTLPPQAYDRWVKVDKRSELASGILTMPIFLYKYASIRSRANVLWNAFACKHFVAPPGDLPASTEPDLASRPGCATCHATIEPLAAYFARLPGQTLSFLPVDRFPALADKAFFDASPLLATSKCIQDYRASQTKSSTICAYAYDDTFTFVDQRGADGGVAKGRAYLKGAYASIANADAGPKGLGQALTSSPDFASCTTQQVLSSFLGRRLTPQDDELKTKLEQTLVGSQFKMKAMVRALLLSDTYRNANNVASDAWRAP